MLESVAANAGAEQPRSNYGSIGDISMDELKARRLQRQQAERQAQLVSCRRTSFNRRPMQPVQPSSNQTQVVQSGKADSCADASSKPLNRVAKRPLEQAPRSTATPHTAEEPEGVSTEQLAKLLDDPTDVEVSVAKRHRQSDPIQVTQQHASAEDCSVVSVRTHLITQQRLDPTTAVATAHERVDQQRRVQQAAVEAAAKAAAEAAAVKAAREAEAKAAAAAAGKQTQAAQHAEAADAAQHQEVQRWRYDNSQAEVEQQQKGHVQQRQVDDSNKAAPAQPSAPSAKPAQAAVAPQPDHAVLQGKKKQPPGKPESGDIDVSQVVRRSTRAAGRGNSRARGEAADERNSKQAITQEPADGSVAAADVKDKAKAATRYARTARGKTNAVLAASGLPPHNPLRHLAAATLRAPSRRVQQLQTAATEGADGRSGLGSNQLQHPQDTTARQLVRSQRAAPNVGTQRVAEQLNDKLQQQQQPTKQQSKSTSAGTDLAKLPTPLACRVATAATGAGAGGDMVLLDSDSDMDDLVIDELEQQQQQQQQQQLTSGNPTIAAADTQATVFVSGEGAAWFAARMAAAAAAASHAEACDGRAKAAAADAVDDVKQPDVSLVAEHADTLQSNQVQLLSTRRATRKCTAPPVDSDSDDDSDDDMTDRSEDIEDQQDVYNSDDIGSECSDEQVSHSSSGWEESDDDEQLNDSAVDPDDAAGKQNSAEEIDAAETNELPKGAKRKTSRAAAAAAAEPGRSTTRMVRQRTAAAAAVDGDGQHQDDEAADKDDAHAAATKKRQGRRSAAGAATGAVRKKKTAAEKKPRAKKVTHRQNFRRHRSNGTGYGFKFLSKSGAHASRRPFRRIINGKLIRGKRTAPHMAGQGAEFLEGFAGSVSGGGGTAGRGRCFKCGQAGHWESECPLNAAAIAAQEAEMAAWKTAQLEKEQERLQQQQQDGYADEYGQHAAAGQPEPEAIAAVTVGYPQHKAALQQQEPPPPPQPLSVAELCSIVGQDPAQPWQPDHLSDDQLRSVLKAVWGYEQFRGKQLPLIRAALQGRSMLGVLPTGLGKSLTYQLPALLLQGLVVVVSPLLALMRDQISRLPDGLTGAMLQGSMTRQEVEQILDRAESGQLRLLYVAPEKLSAGPVLSCLKRLSPLPLVCVDEAHCMAEWGQGFRPAYFRLGHLLCNVLCPRAVLALTATATPPTRACIRQLLAIPPEHQLVESPLRDNLRLRVVHCNGASKGGGVAASVVQLLTTGDLSSCRSVVVYTGTRAAADALAAQLQRAAVTARPYHAGMKQQQRELVQTAFTSGVLRVVVATVAFGMGVDKQDLDAVLHTSLPHSLEEYVQQVGRAGRDGRTGHCILFLDDADYIRMRALTHSGMVRKESIESFLEKVFGREADDDEDDEAANEGKKKRKKKQKLQPSQHRCVPLQATCAELDANEEVLECCLSFLQADPVEPYLVALPNAAATIDVRFHKRTAEELAENHPVVASILQAKTRKYAGTYKVHLDALLSVADRPPGELLSELVSLASAHEIGFDLGKDGALVWRLERQPEEWREMVDNMVMRLDQIIRASVARLDRCYFALAGAAVYSSQPAQERHMRVMIDDYFMDARQQQGQQTTEAPPTEAAQGATAAAGDAFDPSYDGELASADLLEAAMQSGEMPWGGVCPVTRPTKGSLLRQLRAAVHCLSRRILDLGRAKFSGLSLARMLAGLGSPAVPVTAWKGCNEWGTLAAVDFRLLVEVADVAVEEFWAHEA